MNSNPDSSFDSLTFNLPVDNIDTGFVAVISSRFGDIFYANALNNGLLLIIVDQATHDFLLRHDQHALHIDIKSRQIDIPGLGRIEFALDRFTLFCCNYSGAQDTHSILTLD